MPDKLKLAVLFSVVYILVNPAHVLAARTVNTATLNGASSVTVAPGATITAAVNVTTSGGGIADDWLSTGWNISGANCVNHTDHTSAGTYSESFSITAPGSAGTYSVSFVAYNNDTCSSGASNTLTLTNAITVASPTATPTPAPSAPPGSTATPTSVPGSATTNGNTPTPGPTYYPVLTLVRSGLIFTGTASVEKGTLIGVEYSQDGGNSWTGAAAADGKFNNPLENYNFTLKNTFKPGNYTILTRAKSQAQVYTLPANYAAVTFSVSPPEAALNEFGENPTDDNSPTVEGTATGGFGDLTRAEVSPNGGVSWLTAILTGGKFKITFSDLEDGNYTVVARVFDSMGNSGLSEAKILVVDTIPPIIGGNMVSLGPQILTGGADDLIRTVAGAEITLTTSLKGGVSEATITTGEKEFPMKPIAGTSLWTAKLVFDTPGQYPLMVNGIDGAGNRTQRQINQLITEEAGHILDITSGGAIKGANVTVYFQESSGESWVAWDGPAFGQNNPKITSENGEYSYLLPAGRYYLEAKAPGFRTARSQILNLTENTTLNFDLPLTAARTWTLKLPILGEVRLTWPTLRPPDTITADLRPQTAATPVREPIMEADLSKMSATNIDGVAVNPVTTAGKKIVTFVSTWSVPSLEQIPILNGMENVITGKVYVIFLQESPAAVKTFMRRGNYQFEALADKNGESTGSFPVTTLPQHFFVNSQNRVQEVDWGVLSKEKLLERLSRME